MIRGHSPTIIALSTPRGHGGIAIVRLSGSDARPIAGKIFRSKQPLIHQKAVLGSLYDRNGFIDTAVSTYFKAPDSYTGEDLVELSLHGNPYLCDLVIAACMEHGAQPAGPGEFTQRAFLNGKMDLSQAEGVADLIYSMSRAAQKISSDLLKGSFGKEIRKLKSNLIDILSAVELEMDFQEEEIKILSSRELREKMLALIKKIDNFIKSYEVGKILREGICCPIIGPPNSGKSSLFNAFLQEERVIVSPHPGTTRDFIEEIIRTDNYQIRFIDTAGLRESNSRTESAGIRKTQQLVRTGDIILYVVDVSRSLKKLPDLPPSIIKKTIFVLNKIDIAAPKKIQTSLEIIGKYPHILCSALNNDGIPKISEAIIKQTETKIRKFGDIQILSRQRHKNALAQTKKYLTLAKRNLTKNFAPEIIAIDLREALNGLDTILGKTDNEDVLNHIFSHFCIGK